MIIGLVGAIPPDIALRKLATVFGGWRNDTQQPIPLAPEAPRLGGLVRCHVPMPDKHQVDLVLGLPGPRRAAPDYLDASLMNTIRRLWHDASANVRGTGWPYYLPAA
jgi:predicted Zn-dependent peptidase